MIEPDSFMSHLVELRDRLLRCVFALVLVFICLFPWARDLYSLLAKPLLASLPAGGQLIATEVTAPFFVPIKVTLMAALVVALPYLLYQIWAFVAPGLYAHEKKLVMPLVITSTLLFLCGMAFAYFLVFPIVFHFIISVAPEGVAVMTDIGKYLDFVLTLFVAFGVTFEVPVAVVILVRMGMVSVAKLREIRPYVIVGAFVIGAIFTPPDMVSQVMLAVPLWVLYEIGVFVAQWVGKSAAEETTSDPAA
jgi:sec-independent protein translocase protein TatC